MKILYLYAKKWYEQKMSIGRCLYGEALAAHPDVELKFWGNGWDGWRDERTIRQNLHAADYKPDWIWIYKGEDYKGVRDSGIPRFLIFNEANNEKTISEIRSAAPERVGFHHMNDIPRWTRKEAPGAFHIPHCGEIDLEAESAQRPVDCLVAGELSETVYPLRTRLAGLATQMGISRRRYHPGYRLQSHDAVRLQYLRYRRDLRRAKTLLTCSSVYRYPLAKYIEAAHSGTVIVGDLPEDAWFRESLGPYIVEVDNAWSDQMLVDCVRSHLKDESGLKQRAAAAMDVARSQFSMEHYAERLLQELRRDL